MDQLELIHRISHRLDLFRSVNGTKQYRFRCNICGDSKKSATKSRGFFIYSSESDSYYFKCHNCGVSMSLVRYLREYFPDEYAHYRFEAFTQRRLTNITTSKLAQEIQPMKLPTTYSTLLPVTSSNEVIEYLKSRKVPESKWYRLLYTENLHDTVRELDVNKKYIEKTPGQEPRIILPIHDTQGHIIGLQGRALPGYDVKLRYVTYMFTDGDKLFGISNVDWNKLVIVTEGAIDSLFLENAFAINGGSSSLLEKFDKSNLIIAFDNEPYNEHTVRIFKKLAKSGYRIVDWSGISSTYKDINDMVLYGNYTPEEIQEYIINNSYTGLQAQLNLAKWK